MTDNPHWLVSSTIALALLGCTVVSASPPERPELPHLESGEISSAVYVINIPEGWNGGLVLYAHGYSAGPVPGTPWSPKARSEEQRAALRRIEDPSLAGLSSTGRAVLQAAWKLGCATARSLYSRAGWAVREGTLETEQLRAHFERTYGPTSPTIVVGHHMGGAVAISLVERYPEDYDGALISNAPVSPSLDLLKTRVFTMRLLFDYYFPPGLPGSVVEFPRAIDARSRVPALVAGHPGRLDMFLRMFELDSAEELASCLGFYSVILYELAEHRAGGNAFDNRNVIYLGSDDDEILNRRIPRYAAAPEAVEYLRQWCTPTGKISDPVLVVNSLGDFISTPEAMRYYDEATQRKGTSHLYVQMWRGGERGERSIDRPELAERVLRLLDAWIRDGIRPARGELTVD